MSCFLFSGMTLIWHDVYVNRQQAANVQCGLLYYSWKAESGKRKAELVLYGMVWYGMVWYGTMVWYGMVWYGTKARLTMKRKWETEIQRFRSEKKVHCTMYDVRCNAMQCPCPFR